MLRNIDVNLYDRGRLETQFGPFVKTDTFPGRVEAELLGAQYARILQDTSRLVAHQWREHIERSALKGFLFHGGPGTGKTSMAKRIAYEMCRVFEDGGGASAAEPGNEVVLVMIDGSDIARGRYGDSEERLADFFEYARDGESHGHTHGGGHDHGHAGDAMRRTVLLFDDVESLFMARSAAGAREWHFSQNSVFFHGIDELDTSHTVVVLTTNRIDLVDAAVIDRFMCFEFSPPSVDVQIEVARDRARLQHLNDADIAAVIDRIREGDPLRSLREVERLVTQAYVNKILTRQP
ncbi:MAG: hypothetical protein A3H35_20210 [Betaproteobacteria bacterium RIFCSPLOWO2_02_FULL_62_17]|nr:MAG: hypothetical protein A3H35_20210 [Betaproteobacteria bacterium RIFCSPLOWO2_02_FULL_62_17]